MVAEKPPLNSICCNFSCVSITTMEQQIIYLGEEIIGEKCSKISSSQSLSPFLVLQVIYIRTLRAE